METKSHTGLEELIKGLAGRAKKSKESSDPMALRSDELHYDLSRERLEARLDAWRQGKPSIESEGRSSRLYRSMGFEPALYASSGEYAEMSYGEHMAICEGMGFPADKLCPKIVMELSMAQIDTLPKPDVIVSDSHGCDSKNKYTSQSQAELFNIPIFFLDIPLHEDDKPTLASINYVAYQFGEFIEWAEKNVPGVKYNEAMHAEMLEMDAIGMRYIREIYQLVKRVPCPVVPLDTLLRVFDKGEPSRYPNPRKVHEYLRMTRDELGERVTSGKGPYAEERLRLLWGGMSHEIQALNPKKLLMERKVAMPLAVAGHTLRHIGLRGTLFGEVSQDYGIKLSPLQEEADNISTSNWGGPGKRWVNRVLQTARDIGAQGIIHYNLFGCTAMRTMGSVVADRAKRELGIPTLNFEGSYLDKDYMKQEHFDEVLSAFIDKCFNWAEKARQ